MAKRLFKKIVICSITLIIAVSILVLSKQSIVVKVSPLGILNHSNSSEVSYVGCSASPGSVNINSQIPEFSIQGAINNAVNGDTICVGAGTYSVSLYVYNKYINIQSAAGASQTFLISPNSQPILVWQDTPFTGGLEGKFEGFTITGGYSPSSFSGQAGGLTFDSGADILVRYCDITSNGTANYGGGVIINNSSPVFSNDSISNNNSQNGGGGMLIVGNSLPSIYDDLFQNNTASFGGGVWVDSGAAPNFVNDTFSNNGAVGSGGAIGERLNTSGIIEDSAFTNNYAAYGGAIDLENHLSSGVSINDNNFSNNSAQMSSSDPGSGYGGAISAYNYSIATINGNIFDSNTATQGGAAIVTSEGANIQVNKNIFYSNAMITSGSGEGGGIYASGSGSATSNGNCFSSNSAGAGGALAVEVGGTISSSNDSFIDNTATVTSFPYSGAIRDRMNNSTLDTSSDLFVNNSGSQIELDGTGSVSNGSDDLSVTNSAYYAIVNGTPYSNIGALPTADFQSTGSVAPVFNSPLGPTLASCYPNNYSQVNAGVIPSPSTTLQPVYRFYSFLDSTHFFTMSLAERNAVLQIQPVGAFHYEGIAWYAMPTSQTVSVGTTNVQNIPVARYVLTSNPSIHFYTVSATEEATLLAPTWQLESPSAFYVMPPNTSGYSNVCRFDLKGTSDHFYTSNPAECSLIAGNSNWVYEGVPFSVSNSPY